MNPFDDALFHTVNHFARNIGAVDLVMIVLAQYSLEMYALIFFVGWFTPPWSDEDRRHGLVVAFLGGLVAIAINSVIGAVWFRPRPFAALAAGQFHQLIPHIADASFPSDHVAVGFGFAAGSWRRSRGWVTCSFGAITLLVMIARVYVGVHWPTDVLGGAAVGILSGRVVQFAAPHVRFLTRMVMRLFRMKPDGGNDSSKAARS